MKNCTCFLLRWEIYWYFYVWCPCHRSSRQNGTYQLVPWWSHFMMLHSTNYVSIILEFESITLVCVYDYIIHLAHLIIVNLNPFGTTWNNHIICNELEVFAAMRIYLSFKYLFIKNFFYVRLMLCDQHNLKNLSYQLWYLG